MPGAFGDRESLFVDSFRWAGAALFAAAFFLLRKFRPNPILVMVLCGAAGLVLGLLGIQV